MTVLADRQAELRVGTGQALVIGDGTQFPWTENGPDWWSSVDIRTSDAARTGANGVTAGRDLLGKHSSTFIVSALAGSESEVGDLIDQWKAATAIAPDTLVTVRLNALGHTRRRVGRFRKSDANASMAPTGYVAICSTLFEALDGRTFGDTANSATIGRLAPGAGFSPVFTVPFTLGASTGGYAAIVNAGNAPAPWTAQLAGPLAGITISHIESGRRLDLSLTANGGLALGSGDVLNLDSDARSVLLNGTADRRTQLTIESSWWELDPGTNTFLLEADSGTGTLAVTAYDAFQS